MQIEAQLITFQSRVPRDLSYMVRLRGGLVPNDEEHMSNFNNKVGHDHL